MSEPAARIAGDLVAQLIRDGVAASIAVRVEPTYVRVTAEHVEVVLVTGDEATFTMASGSTLSYRQTAGKAPESDSPPTA